MVPKSVPIETVGVGDIVTITFKQGDVKRAGTGTIADIVRHGHERIVLSGDGIEIGRYRLDKLKHTLCVLHHKYEPEHTKLFDLGE